MDTGESQPQPAADVGGPDSVPGSTAAERAGARHPMIRPLMVGALTAAALAVGALAASPPLRERLGGNIAGLWRPASVCGNGRVERDEECDDGNKIAEDGCLPSCKLATCGDGIRRAHVEECDDGNRLDGDGCSSGCLSCPDTATSFSSPDAGHCYWREAEPATYSEAAASCARKHGHLATYGNDLEWRQITERLLTGNGINDAWIGLRQEDRNGVRDFAWVSGERLLSAHWAVHEPRRDPSFVCAAQSARGAWVAAPCDERRQFVCERPRWYRPQRSTHAYLRFVDPMSWDQAAATCADNGGQLVTFDSLNEQERISRRFPGPIWIGARLDLNRGDFGWTTGQAMSYRDFAPGEPNLLKVQHCVALDVDGRWYNRECTDLNRFVCEVP
jgi:cysteine-rich repeat protein